MLVGALLRDHAIFQYDDFIRIADGTQPMRDGEHGTAFHQSFQRLNHQPFGFGVQSRRRLVEDKDGIVADDGPRNADPLPLASGKRIAPFSDQGVIAIGHAGDEFVGIGQLRRFDNLLFGCAVAAVGDIVADCSAEEHRFLQHVADLVA